MLTFRRKKRAYDEVEFLFISMIDIVFNLLIFFICGTTITRQWDLL